MRSRLILILPGLALWWLAPFAAAAGLSILLTNDDGYDAPGLRAVRTALTGAGHAVTVVAPLTQQSGAGMKITLGTLDFVDHGDGLWTVDGSPADAVSFGLRRVMKDAPPDLVVSGANLGQNLGRNTMSSGTVGAAATAAHAGIPAIAISVGLDWAERSLEPVRFPSTLAAFPDAAGFVVRLVAALDARRSTGTVLLPEGMVINVNYPALPAESIQGVRVGRIGRYGGFRLVYPEGGAPGRIRSTIEIDPRGWVEPEDDTALFAAGYVTLSELEPRWTSSNSAPGGTPTWIVELARALGLPRP